MATNLYSYIDSCVCVSIYGSGYRVHSFFHSVIQLRIFLNVFLISQLVFQIALMTFPLQKSSSSTVSTRLRPIRPVFHLHIVKRRQEASSDKFVAFIAVVCSVMDDIIISFVMVLVYICQLCRNMSEYRNSFWCFIFLIYFLWVCVCVFVSVDARF